MRRRTVSRKSALLLAVATAAPLLVVGSAAADYPVGRPGEPNCHGQTIARLAQSDDGNGGGLREVADAQEISVQLLQLEVIAACMGMMG